MKSISLAFALLLVSLPTHAADPSDATALPSTPTAPAAPESAPDIYPRWSIVGDWRMTHQDWTGTLTIRADGTLTNTMGSTGRWFLAGDGGQVIFVIRWDAYGTESLAMVTPDHFRGQRKKGRYNDMRRGVETATLRKKTSRVLANQPPQ